MDNDERLRSINAYLAGIESSLDSTIAEQLDTIMQKLDRIATATIATTSAVEDMSGELQLTLYRIIDLLENKQQQ